MSIKMRAPRPGRDNGVGAIEIRRGAPEHEGLDTWSPTDFPQASPLSVCRLRGGTEDQKEVLALSPLTAARARRQRYSGALLPGNPKKTA